MNAVLSPSELRSLILFSGSYFTASANLILGFSLNVLIIRLRVKPKINSHLQQTRNLLSSDSKKNLTATLKDAHSLDLSTYCQDLGCSRLKSLLYREPSQCSRGFSH